MKYLYMVTSLSSIVLQVFLLSRLLKGAFRRYPVVFGYAIILFITSLVTTPVFFEMGIKWRDTTRKVYQYYWISESILGLLIYVLVLSLIFRALEEMPNRGTIARWMTLVALAIAALVGYFSYDPTYFNRWMTDVALYLSFLAAFFDLILWMSLLRQKHRDTVLLLVSGGLGMMMTGQAIGHALRALAMEWGQSRVIVNIANIVVVCSPLLCLWVWIQAFGRVDATKPASLPAQ